LEKTKQAMYRCSKWN